LARKHPELFRDGDILDIGANIGYTACIFAQAMESGARVFAFEPDRPSYKLLKEVVLRKNLSAAIEVFNTAVRSTKTCGCYTEIVKYSDPIEDSS
jgi:FkbM family methyltransferase